MNDDERFVREHWEDVTVEWGRIEGKLYGMATSQSRPIYLHGYKTEAEIWPAARRFTEERLEQIRQVEEEIKALTRNSYAGCEDYYQVIEGTRDIVPKVRHHHALSRILAVEQSRLDSLRRGMKQPAAQPATGEPAPMTDERANAQGGN